MLSEFAWTRARGYKRPRGEVAERVAMLLDSPEFQVGIPSEAARALKQVPRGTADFADYFLAETNLSAGCSTTATFDGAALKSRGLFAAATAAS